MPTTSEKPHTDKPSTGVEDPKKTQPVGDEGDGGGGDPLKSPVGDGGYSGGGNPLFQPVGDGLGGGGTVDPAMIGNAALQADYSAGLAAAQVASAGAMARRALN